METILTEKKHLFPLVGQWEITRKLQRIIATGYVGQAYLFHGPEGVGKEGFALEFAAMLNCNGDTAEIPCGQCNACYKIRKMESPDVSLIFPIPRKSGVTSGDEPFKGFTAAEMEEVQQAIIDKGLNPYKKINIQKANNIPINSIRELRRSIYLTSHESRWKVVIIFQAEKMRQEAVNALLKVIEEPPPGSIFILTTDYYDQILPTIKSRCQSIYFPPLKENEVEEYLLSRNYSDPEEVRKIALLSNGSIWQAQQIAEEGYEKIEQDVMTFFSALKQDRVENLKRFVDEMELLKRKASQRLKFRFQLLAHWLHDLSVCQQGLDQKWLYFPGLEDFTSEFARDYPAFDVTVALSRLEKCVELIEKNVYIRLTLLAMIMEWQGLIKKGGG